MLSFHSPTEAEDHPLALALMRLEGVDNVFIVPDFITVTKEPSISWDDLLPAVKQVIQDRQP